MLEVEEREESPFTDADEDGRPRLGPQPTGDAMDTTGPGGFTEEELETERAAQEAPSDGGDTVPTS